MNLKQLLNEGKLKHYSTSREEIDRLLKLIERDMNDARVIGLSSDRRFAIVYNAVFQTARILLHCRGYTLKGAGYHFTIFQALKRILGKEHYELIDYFDSCRSKRNITEYTSADEISEAETEELISEAEQFLELAHRWIKSNYPELL